MFMVKYLFVSLILIFLDLLIFCHSQCSNAYSCYNTVVSATGGWRSCRGFFACAYSSIYLYGDSASNQGAACYGSYSCYNSEMIYDYNNPYNETQASSVVVYCNGVNSCSHSNIMMIDGTAWCEGELSCSNVIMTAYSAQCFGDRSCMSSIMTGKGKKNTDGLTFYFYGHASGANGTFYCQHDNWCKFEFRGHLSGYNATIICRKESSCYIECYNAACYGINRICSDGDNNCTWHVLYCSSAIYDGIFCTNGYQWPNDIYPILNDYYLPNFINNIDIFNGENSGNNVLDTIYDEYGTRYENSASVCSTASRSCDDRNECQSGSLNFDTLWNSLNNENGDINSGICCTGQESCTSSSFTTQFDSNINSGITYGNSNNGYDVTANYIRCDACDSCEEGSFSDSLSITDSICDVGDSNNTKIAYINVYLAGTIWNDATGLDIDVSTSYSDSNDDDNCMVISNVFVTGSYGAWISSIDLDDNEGNVYCNSYQSCYKATILNVKNVFGYGYGSLYQSKISNIRENVYCNAHTVCQSNTIEYVDGSVYAVGTSAAWKSSISHIGGSVIGFGASSLKSSNIENIDGYLICIGTQACHSATIYGVKKGVIAYGTAPLHKVTIYTNYYHNNSFIAQYNRNRNVTIHINGTHTDWYTIKCTHGDYCDLYCESKEACTYLNFTCNPGHCSIYCGNWTNEFNVTYDCPITSDSTTMVPTPAPTFSPSKYPSGSPSEPPSNAPSDAPSIAPTFSPTTAPSDNYCDETIQTRDTYSMCTAILSSSSLDNLPKFIMDSDVETLNLESWTVDNYCNVSPFSNYFECYDDRITIKTIDLSFQNLTGQLTSAWVNLIPQNVTNLNLANNNFYGRIDDWSAFSVLQRLKTLKINNNKFDRQVVDWSAFEELTQLAVLDLSFNQFGGTIEFSYMAKIKYLNVANNLFSAMSELGNSEVEYLEQLYIENNNINSAIYLSSIPKNNFTIFHCYNNSLYGNLDINDIPETLVEFDCGNNDFGRLTWEYSTFYWYELIYLDLSHCSLTGDINSQVFAVDSYDAEFAALEYVYLNDNPDLNVSINFEHLSGTRIKVFNVLNTITSSYVDFSYLTSFIVIKLAITTKCISSYCSDNGNGKIITWTRTNETCVGVTQCEATCNCVTEFEAGLETYTDDGTITILSITGLVLIGILLLFVIAGWYHSKGIIKFANKKFKQRDDFTYYSCLSYLFQLWDFISDVCLCCDIFNHYEQESIYSPDKDVFLLFFVLSLTFLLVPWITNLWFLLKARKRWQVAIRESNIVYQQSALSNSFLYTSHWLEKNGTYLVLFCMLSGGLPASLALVNSNWFGLDLFNMRLPKYKQDEYMRHKLWLVVVLENVPQMIVNVLYAVLLLNEFGIVVILAFTSSFVSVILALISFRLKFPKHYYIYEMKCELVSGSQNDGKFLDKLRQTRRIGLCITRGMIQEYGYVFVENVSTISDSNGMYILMNVVCGEKIAFELNNDMKRKIIEHFEKSLELQVLSINFSYVKHECIELLTFKHIFQAFIENNKQFSRLTSKSNKIDSVGLVGSKSPSVLDQDVIKKSSNVDDHFGELSPSISIENNQQYVE